MSASDRVNDLRVLHIAAPATASGANWMVDILRGLKNRGYNVVALINGTQGDLAPKLEHSEIPYFVLDLDLFSEPLAAATKLLKLVLFLRRHKFDIVHYHLFPSVISGRIASWTADVPLRFSMITGPIHLMAATPSKIDLRTQWMDTRVIASCEYTRELYCKAGVPRKRVERIYYGADETRFDPSAVDGEKFRRELGVDNDGIIVGMIAYFYPPMPKGSWTPPNLQGRAVKGHETLIQAAKRVTEKYHKVRFVLVGGGWGKDGEAYVRELKETVKAQGLSKTVAFLGYRSDIPNILAGFDISVQCSLNENLGGTIESLLMAKPTIATAVGGMTETILHRETGLLVPPDDSEKLAEAISELLADREEARQLGQNGRRLVLREFTLTKTIDDIDKLYQSSARQTLKRSGAPSMTTHHYRLYRTALNICALTILLPLAFRSILADAPTLMRRMADDLRWPRLARRFSAFVNVGDIWVRHTRDRR